MNIRGDGTTPRAGLLILHKIKMENIQLTSYSKMRVDLAAQVGRCNVHAVISYYMAYLDLHLGIEQDCS